MDRNNDKITSYQLFSVLISIVIGIGILSMPRSLASSVGPDSLILLIIGSIIFLLINLMIIKLVSKFPSSTVIEITGNLTSKFMGKIVGIIYFVYLVIFTSFELRAFGEISKNFLLINTPIEALMITFILTAVYTVRSGIEPLSRLAVVVFPLSLIPALLTMTIALRELDVTYFLPIFRTPIMDLVKALPDVIFAFLGLEFILFIGVFVEDKKNIKKVSIWAMLSIAAIYLVTVFITIGTFGIEETKTLIWPVITLFKTIDLPGTILQNVEVVIMATWLLTIFITLCFTYYGAVLLLSRVIEAKEHNYLTLPLLPIIFILSLIPANVAEIYDLLGTFSIYFGVICVVGIPSLLLIISFFKKKPKRGMKNV